MSKKGRKLKFKHSAKRVHDKIAGRKHSNPETQTHGRPTAGQKTRKVAPSAKAAPSPAKQPSANKPKQEPKAPALTSVPGPIAATQTPLPYSNSDIILTVGEGNLSFSAALAALLGSAENITATVLDDKEAVEEKYPDVSDHVSCIEDLGGAVLFGVDATQLQACKALREKKFHKIIFQFPHVGAGIKDQAANILSNQRMLAGFFASARQFLTSPVHGTLFTSLGPVQAAAGEVHVTLKPGLPYDSWNITALAKAAGFYVKACRPFKPVRYPGYEHRRTLGYDETKAGNAELQDKDCKTWVFVDAKSAGLEKRKRTKAGQQQGANKRRKVDSDSD